MTPRLFEFEGAMRSHREVCEMVPCLSDSTVRAYLNAGIKTVSGMTSMTGKQAGSVRRRAAQLQELVGEWDSK